MILVRSALRRLGMLVVLAPAGVVFANVVGVLVSFGVAGGLTPFLAGFAAGLAVFVALMLLGSVLRAVGGVS